jgi:DNA-binding SARP family transcriptional activator/pimeloyl-ACP methyl ester carboxylesterase
MVEFRILGPVQVIVADGDVPIGGARTRELLAMLLVNANRVVPAGDLADRLWPELPADRAAANLQVRVSALRRALRAVGESDRLRTRPPGYVILVGPEDLDLARFDQLVADGRAHLDVGQADAAATLLSQALELWGGTALADIGEAEFARAERAHLEERRLGAIETRIDALLECGRHAETISELEKLTRDHPLREHLWQQRILALYRSGRQAESLRAYREIRAALVDQLGIEPGPPLRELEDRILHHDAALDPGPARRPSGGVEPVPPTRYVDSGGVHIAYQVVGAGPRDILFVPGLMSHVELAWEDPGTVAFYRRLASLGRLILFDKRDTGLSDRSPRDSPLEERMQDVLAVMDAAACERAAVFGYSEGAPMSILLAATHPERVTSLILGSAFARWFPAPDYPCGPGAEAVYEAMRDIALHRWGQGATIDWFLPSRAASPVSRESLARFERMAISPGAFLRMIQLIRDIDVRAALATIQAPTLVIQRLGDRINPPFYGRYLASHIPGARYFEQPGDHVLRFAEGDELDDMFAAIEGHLASTPSPHLNRSPARVLTTILCGEDVADVATSPHCERHHGRARPGPGNRLLVTFDAPGEAIRCAVAIRHEAESRGIHPRCGIHTGEVDVADDGIAGPSLDVARDLAGRAQPGTILVSRTVKDLVVGSGISFARLGSYRLIATADRWTVYSVTAPQG